MRRTLDLTALRSFLTVAETGGVTRAAVLLNLTQSAVSMQIRRLEDSLGLDLFSRAARRLVITPEGEQLLAYARRLIELNDEAMARLTGDAYEGEIRLGVPHDVVYPQIPAVLKRFAALYPRLRVSLVSSFTIELKERFARGEFDVILTTEDTPGEGGEMLTERGLYWVGAPGGNAAQRRPLRLAFEERCKFRPAAQAALDRAGIAWEIAFTGRSDQVIEAMAAADLALTVRIEGVVPEGCVVLGPETGLPAVGATAICLYQVEAAARPVRLALIDEIRRAYGCCPAEAVPLRAVL